MGLGGKVLMTVNPISPVNWLLLCCFYFCVKKQIDDNSTVKKVPFGAWMVTLSSCMCSGFMVYTVLCSILPPTFPILGWLCH